MTSHEKTFVDPEEKGVSTVTPTGSAHDETTGQWRDQEDFMTRNGMNLKSFQRRPANAGVVELDKSMKPRHLHMIAIGGSIGAGFFVGSGKSFSEGVSAIHCFTLSRFIYADAANRVLVLSSWISPLWVS